MRAVDGAAMRSVKDKTAAQGGAQEQLFFCVCEPGNPVNITIISPDSLDLVHYWKSTAT